MTKQTYLDLIKWRRETFGKRLLSETVSKLKEEVRELDEAIRLQDSEVEMEFADCFILLYVLAGDYGMKFQDIEESIKAKLAINKEREWHIVDGVIKHKQ